MGIKVLAIRTDFIHHGEDSGYKQILKYTHPYKVIGINERDTLNPTPKLFLKYPWLFEFKAFKFRKKVDLIHILYGEDYFRWSTSLFKHIPVVVTFHQPPELLERDVIYGDYRGRIGKWTHLLNKKRFSRLAAAIVTNLSQKEVLKKVMPENKIYYIPLGIHLETMNKKFNNQFSDNTHPVRHKGKIITVGNWLRDWDFYFKVVDKCKDWSFVLINKKLEEKYKKLVPNYSNLTYLEDISDDAMFDKCLESDVQFIPLTGIAGSNALLQGMALGCPLVLPELGEDPITQNNETIFLYQKNNLEDCIHKLQTIINFPDDTLFEIKRKANKYASGFSWEEVGNRTIELYKQLV